MTRTQAADLLEVPALALLPAILLCTIPIGFVSNDGLGHSLAETRWAANHATAWLAFSSAFLRLWVSDESHMIQMPFVVAIAWMAGCI